MKADYIKIETPEKITFTYQLADTGLRIVAYTIDCVIQIILFIVFLALWGAEFNTYGSYGDEKTGLFMAVLYLMLFFYQWFYFMLFEIFLNGGSPGKKICKIRVIKNDGDRLDLSAIVIRNLVRSVDNFPIPYLCILGGFVSMLNKKNKRLGDLMAGTLVVLEKGFKIQEPDFTTKLSTTEKRVSMGLLEKDRLNEKDLYIIRKLLNQKNIMAPAQLDKTAKIIVNKLSNKFDLSAMSTWSDLRIIEEIYKAHTYED